jgi:hypothetical protein
MERSDVWLVADDSWDEDILDFNLARSTKSIAQMAMKQQQYPAGSTPPLVVGGLWWLLHFLASDSLSCKNTSIHLFSLTAIVDIFSIA